MVGFIYTFWFNFRIKALVCSSFANDLFRWISTSFHHHFKIWLLWLLRKKRMQLLHLYLLLYINEMFVYQFKCHLSYRFRYRFSCFQSQWQTKIGTIQNVDETILSQTIAEDIDFAHCFEDGRTPSQIKPPLL